MDMGMGFGAGYESSKVEVGRFGPWKITFHFEEVKGCVHGMVAACPGKGVAFWSGSTQRLMKNAQ